MDLFEPFTHCFCFATAIFASVHRFSGKCVGFLRKRANSIQIFLTDIPSTTGTIYLVINNQSSWFIEADTATVSIVVFNFFILLYSNLQTLSKNFSKFMHEIQIIKRYVSQNI